MIKVAVIGGGAAGFFAAISAKHHNPNGSIEILEKSNKLLAKVKVSGGGRCNVTNGNQSIKELSDAYPRGKSFMKKALNTFSTKDTCHWFDSKGVPLKVEKDGRVFPQSNDSQSIIDCLMKQIKRHSILIRTKIDVKSLKSKKGKIELIYRDGTSEVWDKVIVASGGSPKRSGLEWLAESGHIILDPVPSLFTFNMPKNPITKLMGVVALNGAVSIQGQKYIQSGPILITHWGLSGPAILKLSAYAARFLNESNYQFKINVNWINIKDQNEVKIHLDSIIQSNPKKKLSSIKPFDLPERLWMYLLGKSGLPVHKKWSELGKKGMNKLISTLCIDNYEVSGKTTFKEEFVTCGGVSLESIHHKTMESRHVQNLYFAGEVLDIDGITGGYNFQAAWTTGFIAGKLGN